MNALLQAPDTSSYDSPLVITLLPALPKEWSKKGHVNGARVRGGIGISFEWENAKPRNIVLTFDRARRERKVKLVFGVDGEVLHSFVGHPGMVTTVAGWV